MVDDRIEFVKPESLILAEPNRIRVKFLKPGLISLNSAQLRIHNDPVELKVTVEGADEQPVIHHDADGDYIEVVPLALGRVEFHILCLFADQKMEVESMEV